MMMTDKEIMTLVVSFARRFLRDYAKSGVIGDVAERLTAKVNDMCVDMYRDGVVGDIIEFDVRCEANDLQITPSNEAAVGLIRRATVKD